MYNILCVDDVPANLLVLESLFEENTNKYKVLTANGGLHMSYKLIVEGMNGEIKVENENYTYKDGNYIGASFKIIIPNN
jgi:hypothetical protein